MKVHLRLKKFVTNLYDAFQILEKYEEPLYEQEKLRLLFNKCQNAHPAFKQEVVICRTLCKTFASAVVHLKIVVARLFPDVLRRNVSSKSRMVSTFLSYRGGMILAK